MIKIVTVFGTRPEAIKIAPIVKELKKHPDQFDCIVTITAQHREMLDTVLETFNIKPDYDLNIMKKNQALETITISILSKLNEILIKEKPDIVLVHGDTTTTFASALSAFYHQIPVGHVEAGLRTYNLYSPYSEEANRQMVSHITTLHFAPTEISKQNLLNESISENNIFITGNTAIDALKTTVKDSYDHPDLQWASESRLILLTAHRRENQGEPLRNIFTAINEITNKYSDVKIIYPIHLNPKIRSLAHELFDNNDQIRLIEPLDVFDFHNFIKHSYLILTDSGGIQEEAPSLGVPVLVLRDTTERPEGIKAGTLKLIGTNKENIVKQVSLLLDNTEEHSKMSKAINPYGDGHASEKIISSIKYYFDSSK